MVDDFLDLFVRDKRPVDTSYLGAAGHIEHVAHAQKLLGALFAQDSPTVDL